MTLVCDASALVATLIDAGPRGDWLAKQISGSSLAAPCLIDFEVVNVLRRHVLAERLGLEQATQAIEHLHRLRIERWPYEPLAARVWELRNNASAYDASYVALAEFLSATLVTLDVRLAGVPGLRCEVATPPV